MFYCFLADGFEETEALAPVDILRRAGVTVKIVGVGGDLVRGSHNIFVHTDMRISNCEHGRDLQGIILPGGMPGVKHLDCDEDLHEMIRYCEKKGLLICAICAAPSILGRMGVLKGRKATCFPGFEDALMGAEVSTDKVVVDGNIITAKGAGCALDFGFAIAAAACGEEKAEAIASAMQCR